MANFCFVIPVQILIVYLYVNEVGDRPLGTIGFLVVNAIIFLTYFLFYGLTTKVNSSTVTISFGIGIIRKNIQLKRIIQVEVVKSPWYYGWGIRFIPNGMLYNISGSDGVELSFNDTNRVIRIGTKDSGRLKEEVLKRLSDN
jgi:hypothetical protein